MKIKGAPHMDKKLKIVKKNGDIAFSGKIAALPISRKFIVDNSIEFFHDSNPCIIHQSYIIQKAICVMDEYIEATFQEGKCELLWDQIPQNIKDMLPYGSDTDRIFVCRHD